MGEGYPSYPAILALMRKSQLLFLIDTILRGGGDYSRTKRRRSLPRAHPRQDYLLHKETARVFVKKKLEEWNQYYGFSYNRITIRDQRSRWGSCSKKGNLNFNYRIIHLPEQLADLVIVHELCHLKEFNHSLSFWNLVARAIPDHLSRRHTLARFSLRETPPLVMHFDIVTREKGAASLIALLIGVLLMAFLFVQYYLAPIDDVGSAAYQPMTASGTAPKTEIERAQADIDAAKALQTQMNLRNEEMGRILEE